MSETGGPGSAHHVLFDADGVMQETPGGWYAAMERYLGDCSREFLHWTWKHERPTLVGCGDYMPVLERDLREYGVDVPAGEIFADVWCRIDVNQDSVALVHRLREQGVGVHLGTNQEQHRAAYMKTRLGFEGVFDVRCYSYEVGAAKPDPGFFSEAVSRIGAEPSTILFIDDSERNVEGARSAGLNAERWDLTQGHHVLADVLGTYGLAVDR